MPQIKFTQVLSYSSESQNYPADNLLKSDGYGKWKCKEGTEDKQSWVTLKLEKLVSINAIDIGNENSALIEVLVAREGVDFQVLLVASSFMTPADSRNGTNTSRVRIFEKEKLTKGAVDQKWDRIKVMCTQPFAKNVQYGLSFIKVHSLKDSENSGSTSGLKLGRFTLKEEEDSSDSLKIGSFFNKRKEKEKSPPKGAAAIRAASNAISNDPVKIKHSEENAPNLGFYQLKKQTKISDSNESKDKKSSTPSQNSKTTEKSQKDSSKHSSETSSARDTSKNNIIRKRKSRPFSILMQDVTFVMSGYQNPKRSNLRDKMLDMGAKYKSDWGDSCTHLICAFTNTPKFQAVKGKGKIVSEKWIEDCHRKKIRLPWRRYNLEKNRNADESEEEIYAEEILPKEDVKNNSERPVEENQDDASNASSEDTEDEIERIMNKGKQKINKEELESPRKKLKSDVGDKSLSASAANCLPSDDEAYDADTDVDEDLEKEPMKKDTSHMPLPPLSEFFKGKVFFIFGMNEDSSKKLHRYLTAYSGKVRTYMAEDVQFVVTDNSWDDNFETALNENSSLQFVKPEWIWKCCDKLKFVPPQPYLIVPLA